jgi:hypothetical protein
MTNFAEDIAAPLGAKRSGRVRYAAAMGMYQAGTLGPDALEVYRICSLLDAEDPAPLLAELGLSGPAARKLTAEVAIRALIDAADRYLATLPGPGVPEVRAGLNRWRTGPVQGQPSANAVKDAWLGSALAQLGQSMPDLAHAVGIAAPYLGWKTYDDYPPAQIGPAFANGHCYATLIGEGGAIEAQDYDLGLFLIAPHVLYRDRNHAAPELYAPLTGPHGWRFGPDRPLLIKPAHAPVWNTPFRPHLTKVGPVPFLAIYGWTKDTAAAAQVIPAQDWPMLEALHLDA